MDSSSADLEADLYGNLEDFDYGQQLKQLLGIVDMQRTQIAQLKSELETITETSQKKCAKLEKDNEILETNISSLFKTASAEISRKDRMCKELRVQLDDMVLKFKTKPVNNTRPVNTHSIVNVRKVPAVVNHDNHIVKEEIICEQFTNRIQEKPIHNDNQREKFDAKIKTPHNQSSRSPDRRHFAEYEKKSRGIRSRSRDRHHDHHSKRSRVEGNLRRSRSPSNSNFSKENNHNNHSYNSSRDRSEDKPHRNNIDKSFKEEKLDTRSEMSRVRHNGNREQNHSTLVKNKVDYSKRDNYKDERRNSYSENRSKTKHD